MPVGQCPLWISVNKRRLVPTVSQCAARLRARLDFPAPPLEVARVMTPNIRPQGLVNFDIGRLYNFERQQERGPWLGLKTRNSAPVARGHRWRPRLIPYVIELRDFDFSRLDRIGTAPGRASRWLGDLKDSLRLPASRLFLRCPSVDRVWKVLDRTAFPLEASFCPPVWEMKRVRRVLRTWCLSTGHALMFLCSNMFYVLGPDLAGFSMACAPNYNFSGWRL